MSIDRRRAKASSSLLVTAALLAGCTTYNDVKHGYDANQATIRQKQTEAAAQETQRQVAVDPIKSDDSIFLGNEIISDDSAHILPAGHRHLQVKLNHPLPVKDALKEICDNLGMQFSIDGLDPFAIAQASAQSSEALGAPKDKKPSFSATGSQANPKDAVLQRSVTLGRYDEDGAKYLDRLTKDLDMAWSVDRDTIVFSTQVTKTFEFGADAATTEVTNTSKASTDIDSNSGSGSSGATSNAGVTIAKHLKLDPWGDLSKSLTTLLPPATGGSFTVLPGAGKVIVSAPPSLMRRIEPQIEGLRRNMHRNIVLSVTLFALKTDDKDDYGLNISAALADAGKTFDVAFSTPQTAVVNTAAALSGHVNSLTGNTASLFNGSSAVVQAIATKGHTGQRREANVWTRNNEVVALHKTTQQAYVASIGAANTGSSTGAVSFPTITPGTVTFGYNLLVTPHIVDDTHISVEFGFDLSTLDALADYPVGSGYNVQQPTRTLNNIPTQTIEMVSGETIISSGLRIEDNILNKLGLGADINLPGEISGEQQTSELIIVISASILDGDRSAGGFKTGAR